VCFIGCEHQVLSWFSWSVCSRSCCFKRCPDATLRNPAESARRVHVGGAGPVDVGSGQQSGAERATPHGSTQRLSCSSRKSYISAAVPLPSIVANPNDTAAPVHQTKTCCTPLGHRSHFCQHGGMAHNTL
jgi:hypothetical protein